jgi:hypothetical protein
MIDWVDWARQGNLSRVPDPVIEHAQAHGVSYAVAAWEMAVLADDGTVDELLDPHGGTL